MNFKEAKFISLSLLMALPFLYGCQKQNDKYIKDPSYSFLNGQAICEFKAKGFKEFNLYSKEHIDDEYELIKQINTNTFSTSSFQTFFKVVSLENKIENNDYILEINPYFDMVFNNRVKIFTDQDDENDIQNFIDSKYDYLSIDEWSEDRTEVLFLPGSYDDVVLKNGYYTSFRGLGYSPDDVSFNSLQTVNHPNTGNALINFWRSLENLSFNEDSMWAISQATSIRRGHFKSDLVLSDNRGGNGWSSGGFIANSKIDGIINPGTQQQFLMRNDTFDSWTHSNMNMVFEGCVGETPEGTWIESRTTIQEQSLDVIEKPYLVFDNQKGFGVMAFDNLISHVGHNWSNDNGTFIPLSEFKILTPEDDAKTINNVFKNNKYVIFTPGIYSIDKTLEVIQDNSIIFGLGYATLSAKDNVEKIMSIKSKDNKICSLLFQSETNTKNYLVLEENNDNQKTLLSDLFFRVGGHTTTNVSVDACLIINQNNVIGDNFWIWRADHGKNIGFNKNYARLGCVINGHAVTCHALMIEHFYEYQLMWNGEDGEVIFYQSETPYDLPNQTYWMRYDEGYVGEEAFGYPSYKINNQVINHKALGVGIYYINTSNIYEKCYTALETPCNDGINLFHISARYFGGEGRFTHAINNINGYEEGLNMTVELFDKNTYPELFNK